MKRYLNTEGSSGVTAYETGSDFIKVEFNHSHTYLYTYASAGKAIIEKMKRLAEKGRGLSTYISRIVKDKFENKLN